MRTVTRSAETWLEFKKCALAPKSYQIERTNLGHLLPVGQQLLSDIDAINVSRYQQMRVKHKSAPKTIRPAVLRE